MSEFLRDFDVSESGIQVFRSRHHFANILDFFVSTEEAKFEFYTMIISKAVGLHGRCHGNSDADFFWLVTSCRKFFGDVDGEEDEVTGTM